jgi:hypothetical protein
MSKEFSRTITYWVRHEQLLTLKRVAGRLGLDPSEIARRAMAEGLKKFERAKLPGSPRVPESEQSEQ